MKKSFGDDKQYNHNPDCRGDHDSPDEPLYGADADRSTADTAGLPSGREERQTSFSDQAGARVIPFYDGTKKYQSKTFVIFVAGLLIATAGMPVVSTISNFTKMNLSRIYPMIYFGLTIVLLILLLIVGPLMDYVHMKRVCTCRSTGKFAGYEERPVKVRSGKNTYRTFIGYYPRYLVNCNGKKQIRICTFYRRSPQTEPDKELCFNPDGGEVYDADDKKTVCILLIKAGIALAVTAVLITLLVPSVMSMMK